MPVVISDASPLRYLLLVDVVEVLPTLYGRVLVPQAVVDELRQQRTPELIRVWLSQPPAWLEVVPPGSKGITDPALALLARASGKRFSWPWRGTRTSCSWMTARQ